MQSDSAADPDSVSDADSMCAYEVVYGCLERRTTQPPPLAWIEGVTDMIEVRLFRPLHTERVAAL
jgi:hypothetical protein